MIVVGVGRSMVDGYITIIITARNSSCGKLMYTDRKGKVMFFRSVFLSTGVWS